MTEWMTTVSGAPALDILIVPMTEEEKRMFLEGFKLGVQSAVKEKRTIHDV